MKVPEFMFTILNPIVKLLLRSPLHFLASKDLTVVTFWGRRSGKEYATPVRYLWRDDALVSFSSLDTHWWRNLRDGAPARLRIQGKEIECTVNIIEQNAQSVREWLLWYFDKLPQDAVYHDVRIEKDGTPNETDMVSATQHGVVVIAVPVAAMAPSS